MSGLSLTLRPPPNVDFVHGYPGIPPGNDRPQASVKGAIEVRVPAAGVKAKFVRIELRKVETLPGGGANNTFYDSVGPSPVSLWTSSEEYGILKPQDFPFSIRVPESIPPTITLDNRAGIHYELVATVCTKGKRSWFRKRKNVVVTEIAPVTIDKHDLHSTWPVYCQHEKREQVQEGVTMVVERDHTCFGPGDKISVMASLKSDNLHTVILRGFEMTLKETTLFHGRGDRRQGAPQTKVIPVTETKVAINATLYGGTGHQAELSCVLPAQHTTTSLNAARYIDVTYVLSVKALMGTGTHVVMDLPVIVSNWQRYVSQEAVRRIGHAPSLSLLPNPSISSVTPIQQPSVLSPTISLNNTPLPHMANQVVNNANNNNTFQSTATGGRQGTLGGPSVVSPHVDEMGYGTSINTGTNGYGKSMNTFGGGGGHRPNIGSRGSQDETYKSPIGGNSSIPAGTATGNTNSRRPNSARASVNPGNRLTIMNAEPDSIGSPPQRTTSASATMGQQQQQQPTQPQKWMSAIEEKRFYEDARRKVEESQGVAPPPAISPAPIPVHAPTPQLKSPSSKTYLSAEEQKALYQRAQDAVSKKTTHGSSPPPRTSSAGGSGSKLTGAELYQQATASMKPPPMPQSYSSYGGSAGGGSGGGSGYGYRQGQGQGGQGPAKLPQYLTAEQEKEALKRYEEARLAVNKLHTSDYTDPTAGPEPIAYDSLYPEPNAPFIHQQQQSPTQREPPPPSFDAVVDSPLSALAEKERLRRQYAEQDNYGRQPPPQQQQQQRHFQQRPVFESTPPTLNAPPPSNVNTNVANTDPVPATDTVKQYMDAAAEKEALRRKLEAKDARAAAAAIKQQRLQQAQAQQVPAQAPTRGASLPQVPGQGQRPTPALPTGTKQILTAAEEKAMLKVKRDNKDAKTLKKLNGNANTEQQQQIASRQLLPAPSPLSPGFANTNGNMNSSSPPPPPPPLMPKPPVEYIQETQEEDARVAKFVSGDEHADVLGMVNGNDGNGFRTPGPPPPLPPKPVGE